MALQRLHQCGIALGGRHDDDHLGVGAGGERPERVGEIRVLLHDGGRIVGAPRRHQPPAQDHDAGPLPLLEPLGDVAAGGRGAVGGLGGEQEVADDLHPPAQGHREGAVLACRPSAAGLALPPPCQLRLPFAVHRVTFEASGPSAIWRICLAGGGGDAVRLVLRARDQARGRPDQLDVARRGRRRRTRAGRPSSSTSTASCPTPPAASTSWTEARRDWAAFFEACGDDPVIEEIARLLELLDPSLAVILLTGRPHRVQPQTLAWLQRYGLRWDLLVMRSRGDYAQVTEFKQSVVEDLRAYGFDLRLAFEDDPSNHAMYVAAGVPCVYIHSGYYE